MESKNIVLDFLIKYLARYSIAQYIIIARFSRNLDFGGARIGDRTLAIWLRDSTSSLYLLKVIRVLMAG